jgi:hypothetical protein
MARALDTQRYIASNINVNDTVELIHAGNTYRIVHGGVQIGYLSMEAVDDFWAAVGKTANKNNIPPRLTEIYVNNIVTVVPGSFPSGVDAMFKESNFWLGVELTGFAKADWHWKES